MKSILISISALLVQAALAQSAPLDVHQALDLAAKNRPTVQAAKLKVAQARLNARALGSYPATTLGLGYSTKADIGASDQDAFLSLPVDVFGRTRAGRQSGTALIQQAEAAYRGELIELQSDVLTALTEAVSTVKLSESADLILANAEQLKRAADRKFEEGKIAEVQQTRAAIEVMRARQTSDLRRKQKGAALKLLAAALGSNVDEAQLTSFPELSELAAADVSLNPELLILSADIQAAKADASVAQANSRPELEIQGIRSPWHDSEAQFGARIQLSWAILDGGRSRNEMRAAEKRLQAAALSLRDARLKAEAELAAALEDLSGARAQVESYQTILDSTRLLLRKTQAGYDEGASTLIDVLDATRALREVEEGSIEAFQHLAEASIAAYRAAGVLVGGLK